MGTGAGLLTGVPRSRSARAMKPRPRDGMARPWEGVRMEVRRGAALVAGSPKWLGALCYGLGGDPRAR